MKTQAKNILMSACASLILSATACSNGSNPPEPTQTASQTPADESPLIIAEEGVGIMPAVTISGTLSETGNCFFVGNSLAVWPQGTVWTPDPPSIAFEGREKIAVGDKVEGGGGPIGDVAKIFGPQVKERLERCNSTAQVIYIGPP